MKKGQKILSFIKAPPVWFAAVWYVLTAALIAASIAMTVLKYDSSPAVVTIYVFSAIFLAYAVYLSVSRFSEMKSAVADKLRKNKYIGRFLDDYGVRTVVYSIASFVINTGYVVVNCVAAAVYSSAWFTCMAAYYLSLMIMRGGILYFGRRAIKAAGADADADAAAIAKWRIYQGCGIAMLVSLGAVIIAVTSIIIGDTHAKTGLNLAIATAAYTFYKLTLAIINMVRAKKISDPAVQSLRNINLVGALVSLLSLQITLGASDSGGMLALNAVMGGVVCLAVAIMGIIMVTGGHGKLKRLKDGKQE